MSPAAPANSPSRWRRWGHEPARQVAAEPGPHPGPELGPPFLTSSYFTPEGAFRASEAAANYGPSTVAYVAEDGGPRWFLARYLDSWSFVPISRRGPFWTFGSRATLSMDDSRPVQAYFGDGLSDAVLYGYRADPAVEALEFRFQTEGGPVSLWCRTFREDLFLCSAQGFVRDQALDCRAYGPGGALLWEGGII